MYKGKQVNCGGHEEPVRNENAHESLRVWHPPRRQALNTQTTDRKLQVTEYEDVKPEPTYGPS